MFTTRKTLLDKLQEGNEESWAVFYENYRGLIFAMGRRNHFSQEDCWDLVQQVMLSIFKNQSIFRYNPELGKFRVYLIGIIRNTMLKMMREKRRIPDADCMNEEEQQMPEIPVMADFEQNLLDEWRKYLMNVALDELRKRVSEQTFDAFQMFVLQEQKPKDIANVLGISVSAIYVYKKRCIECLRECIAKLQLMDPECDFSSH